VAELLDLALAAARAAGQRIRAGWEAHPRRGGALRVEQKGSAINLVTDVDLASEEAIRGVLSAGEPGIPILAEEAGGSEAPTRWVVDPLDGTTNFVHGFPVFAVSIALQVDGRVELGLIYEPLSGRAWTARRDGGAWCEGQRLRVSPVPVVEQALLLTGFPYDRREKAAWYLGFVQAFLERCHCIRRTGAATVDFTHIACGQADGYWEFGLAPWDVAAGSLLVSEAGGSVSLLDGGPFDIAARSMLATNGHIHPEMLQILSPLLSSARR
jgi:myo-inositol-1(or 4)-monophosphatase